MALIVEALAVTTFASTAGPMPGSVTGSVAGSMAEAVTDPAVLAQLSTSSGTALRDIALAIIGTFTLVILAGRAAGALADERYGKLLTLVLAAIPVIGFAYFPDLTLSILKGLYTSGVG